MAGGWAVASNRVTAAEDRLTALEPNAPDDAGAARARALRDAARLARTRMERTTSGTPGTSMLDLDDIMADLDAALGAPPTSPV